jgi:hypothetical protein
VGDLLQEGKDEIEACHLEQRTHAGADIYQAKLASGRHALEQRDQATKPRAVDEVDVFEREDNRETPLQPWQHMLPEIERYGGVKPLHMWGNMQLSVLFFEGDLGRH